jgi:hypothetical protein
MQALAGGGFQSLVEFGRERLHQIFEGVVWHWFAASLPGDRSALSRSADNTLWITRDCTKAVPSGPSSPADRRLDPNGNSIEPPVVGGQPASDASGDPPPQPAPLPPDDGPADKIARLDERRARQGTD